MVILLSLETTLINHFKHTNPEVIWNHFKKIFPKEAKDAYKFTTYRKNSIIVYFKNKRPLVFSSESDNKWSCGPYIK